MTNDKQKRKEIGKEYVQTHRPMGIYQIKNNANGKVLIGSTLDMNGMFNRHRFMLGLGGHANKELQRDWNTFGEEQFSFDVLEPIKPQEEFLQSADELDKYKKELELMEQIWLEELAPYDERGYNKQIKK